jgi:hypothetical protein
MWQFIIAIVFIIFLTFGLIAEKNTIRAKQKIYKKEIYARFMEDGKLERSEIRSMLKNLPGSPDEIIKFGAMCYETISFNNTTEIRYTCPSCGEKTVYTISEKYKPTPKGKSKRKKRKYKVDRGLFWLASNVKDFRRLTGKIKGIDVVLDEKELCVHCSPETSNPRLKLKIKLPGEDTVHHTGPISIEKLKMLIEFTNGKITHKTELDSVFYMTFFAPEIKKLLGIKE